MSMYIEGSEECFLCKKKLDSDKIGIEWFVLEQVDYEAAYGLYQYSGHLCHYDCYNSWEYKKEYDKEVKRNKEHIEEFNKKLENANKSERRQIYEEEVREWNDKVERNKYNFERFPEKDIADGYEPEIDFSAFFKKK